MKKDLKYLQNPLFHATKRITFLQNQSPPKRARHNTLVNHPENPPPIAVNHQNNALENAKQPKLPAPTAQFTRPKQTHLLQK
ncbi:MAG: hypothetical protein EP336_06605 [Rhodobacteraceae bacterium]|nr:MAG: hypothetical protein EP336_06605 [Paracoccaceae bacterium]